MALSALYMITLFIINYLFLWTDKRIIWDKDHRIYRNILEISEFIQGGAKVGLEL